LADQMNITVCELEEWAELPDWLGRLKKEIEQPKARCQRWCYSIDSGAQAESDLEIVCGQTHHHPGDHEAIAFVAGRKNNIPVPPGPFAYLKDVPARKISTHVFEYPGPLYAVTARCHESDDDSAVYQATLEFLDLVAKPEGGVTTVHVQLAASGGSVPPLYGFMEVVRAFGEWRESRRAVRVVLYVQADVELSLTAERIDIRELLTSRLIRFWAVVDSGENLEPVRRALHRAANAPLADVLRDLGVPEDLAGWSFSVCPSPRKEAVRPSVQLVPGLTLREAGIVFGSVLLLERSAQKGLAAGGGAS
jgi:hypothetical protein